MFQSVLNREIPTKLIVVEDSAEEPADELFDTIVWSILRNENQDVVTNFVCSENLSSFYKQKYEIEKSVQFIDTVVSSGEFTIKTNFPVISNSSKNIVIFDSIGPFLWSEDFHDLAREILKLTAITEQIILRVHADTLLNSHHAKLLETISETHLKILNRKQTGFVVLLTQKKHNKKGLLKRQKEVVEVVDHKCVRNFVEAGENNAYSKDVTNIMKKLTTFDLGVSLNPSEKEARERLVLPYLRTGEISPGPQIDYVPDDADLEEDPDEDLEL